MMFLCLYNLLIGFSELLYYGFYFQKQQAFVQGIKYEYFCCLILDSPDEPPPIRGIQGEAIISTPTNRNILASLLSSCMLWLSLWKLTVSHHPLLFLDHCCLFVRLFRDFLSLVVWWYRDCINCYLILHWGLVPD